MGRELRSFGYKSDESIFFGRGRGVGRKFKCEEMHRTALRLKKTDFWQNSFIEWTREKKKENKSKF